MTPPSPNILHIVPLCTAYMQRSAISFWVLTRVISFPVTAADVIAAGG